MGKWIKCSERMPEKLDDVLVTDGVYVEVKWWNGYIWDCWAPRNSDISYKDVTHWMPLPEPPEVLCYTVTIVWDFTE